MSSELLEEIQILNMQFPVHRFFTLLMRKRTAPKEDISALGRKINVFFQEQTTVLSLTSEYLKEEVTDIALYVVFNLGIKNPSQ